MGWKALLDAEIDALADRLAEMGGEHEKSLAEVRDYAANQALMLSEAAGQPGFALAARAAALNAAGFAALTAVGLADEVDSIAREAWVSGLTSALRITAGLIASL
jgi:hypothetical protein